MSSSSAGSFSPGSIASVSEAETCSGQTGREKRILLSSPYAIALPQQLTRLDFRPVWVDTGVTSRRGLALSPTCPSAARWFPHTSVGCGLNGQTSGIAPVLRAHGHGGPDERTTAVFSSRYRRQSPFVSAGDRDA